MTFFFDENFSHHIVKALSILEAPRGEGNEIHSTIDKFGRGAADEVWIPEIAKENGIVVTQDLNIHRTRQQRELYQQHKLGVVFFKPPKKKGYPYWEMVEKLINAWPDIKSDCKRAGKPFAYIIKPRSRKLEKL